MILRSEKFILRAPKMSDLESLHKNINDKTIGHNMRNISYPQPIAKSREFLNRIIKENKLKNKTIDGFIIDVDEECAGAIALSKIIPKHKAIIGYWIGKEYRGKGITTRAVKLITDYGFKKYGLKRIEGTIVIFNKASCRVLEKCGYKREGILKKNRLKNGRYYDDYQYAKVR